MSKYQDRPSILLVDDDLAILEGVADLLTLYDYEVTALDNAQDALEAMQQSIPDLIISDIMMPDMDGYEFFEAVRSNPQWAPIPFIFLTARGQKRDIRLGNSLGADAYQTKPFEPEDLIVLVESRLKRIQEVQSLAQSESERIKRQLITIFSHELRTPLTYIYGYVNMLQDQHPDMNTGEIDEMLTGVQRGADRLVRLVEDLMLIVRIDAGVVAMEIALRREMHNLYGIVQTIVDAHRRKAETHGLEVIVDIPEDLEIPCIPNYFEDALGRIVDNAIKFSKRESDCVRITTNVVGDFIEISVIDQGIGFDPTYIDQVFRRLTQIDRDTMEQQGIGLGLSIARTLVRLHGGEIKATSTPNEGSTFTVVMPMGLLEGE